MGGETAWISRPRSSCPASTFKVREILDYKALPYRRIPILGMALWRVLCRGRVGKAPAMEIGAEMVVDSTDIAHALERQFPQPPILPVDARLRAECQALEDWANETFYFLGLHYQWIDREGARMVRKLFGRAPRCVAKAPAARRQSTSRAT